MSSGRADTAVDKGAGYRAGELVGGHYRVERVLGSGGMGVVVAARDERTGEAVAIKLLRSIDDTRSVERFFREARAMGRLDSEHVVRVRDAGTDGKKPYLVMDCLDGIDLSERAKRSGPLSVRDAVDYAMQACEALSHAHSKGIVHRDIKPSNLFLHKAGDRTVLKVLDFGISKVQTRDVWERTLTTTDDGGVLGSPPYMSPEQVRDPKAVDPRSDVWSLGIVMYKLLSGTVPYDGESVGEVFAKVLERPYPSLRVTTDVPPDIDAIVQRCLTKDREERWHHVGELAEALAPHASPEYAALAPRIAHRMHEEGPTLEHSGSNPRVDDPGKNRHGEPRTMTLSEPPPEARGSAPPPRISSVPQSKFTTMTSPPATTPMSSPPPMSLPLPSTVPGAPPTGPLNATVPMPTLLERGAGRDAGKFPSATPQPLAAGSVPPPDGLASAAQLNTGSLSMDVVVAPPSRARIALFMAFIMLAAGVGIGVALRSTSTTRSDPSTASSNGAPSMTATTPAPVATDPAGSGSTTSASPSSPPSGSSVAAVATAPPKVTGKRAGTRKLPGSGSATVGAAAVTASPPPATTPRPELQPSPYPTAQ